MNLWMTSLIQDRNDRVEVVVDHEDDPNQVLDDPNQVPEKQPLQQV
jgi:hypothetical protein